MIRSAEAFLQISYITVQFSEHHWIIKLLPFNKTTSFSDDGQFSSSFLPLAVSSSGLLLVSELFKSTNTPSEAVVWGEARSLT